MNYMEKRVILLRRHANEAADRGIGIDQSDVTEGASRCHCGSQPMSIISSNANPH